MPNPGQYLTSMCKRRSERSKGFQSELTVAGVDSDVDASANPCGCVSTPWWVDSRGLLAVSALVPMCPPRH